MAHLYSWLCILLKSAIPDASTCVQEIVYRDYTDISIAVATPKGLVVPVIRNVQDMGFADIEKARRRRPLCPPLLARFSLLVTHLLRAGMLAYLARSGRGARLGGHRSTQHSSA
jgi:2-oxoacid dehydrogenases acyltransferase (catalytic domain)